MHRQFQKLSRPFALYNNAAIRGIIKTDEISQAKNVLIKMPTDTNSQVTFV